MARKAPKNPINDIVDTVGAWFGGRGPGTNPQVSRASRDLGRAVSAADTVTGGFGAAALRDVKKFQQGGSLPTNLAKTTAVNLAAGAVGAKAAQVAGQAITKSGIILRATRAVTGRNTSYFVHGSPTTGIKKLDPIYETMPDKIASEPWFEDRWPEGVDPANAGIYGWPITKATGEKGTSNILNPREEVLSSIKDSYGYSQRYGSVYVAKAPRNMVGSDSDEIISAPSKVVKEIRTKGKTADQVAKETEDALKRLGFKYPKTRGGGTKKR